MSKNTEGIKGFLKGLEAVGARPATPRAENIMSQVHQMAKKDSEKLMAGANPESVERVATAKLAMFREQVRENNMRAARAAANRFNEISKKLGNLSAAERMAQIQDAQLRMSAMTDSSVRAWADSVVQGEKHPRSEYELLSAISRLPENHELNKKYEQSPDFAAWTPEGKKAHDEMLQYAKLGSKLLFRAENGEKIPADVGDLYSPPEADPEEAARKEMGGPVLVQESDAPIGVEK